MDFYINDGLNWGVKLMREGERMSQHIDRFNLKAHVRTFLISLSAWTIIDFRHHYLIPNCQTRRTTSDALYANDYRTITVVRKDKQVETITTWR